MIRKKTFERFRCFLFVACFWTMDKNDIDIYDNYLQCDYQEVNCLKWYNTELFAQVYVLSLLTTSPHLYTKESYNSKVNIRRVCFTYSTSA